MEKKKVPPSAYKRRNLYWSDEMDEQVIEIAERLHKEGVKGLFNAKSEVNRTAVIRYLITKELSKD